MRRCAFTIVELLVVIAIIGILIALLLPAIHAARESSRKSHCANNVKQIALAVHSFHEANKYLPDGGTHVDDADNPPPDRRKWGWTYQIAPFIEYRELHRITNNATVRKTVVPIFYCTSRRTATLYHNVGVCDYAGNGGTRTNDAIDGVFVRTNQIMPFTTKRQYTWKSLTDGQSQTLMFGERRVNLAWIITHAGDDFGDNESCFGPGWDRDIMRWARSVTVGSTTTTLTPAADANDLNMVDNEVTMTYAFGSSHLTSMNSAFADASTRTISYDVNPDVFKNMSVRNDGKLVTRE